MSEYSQGLESPFNKVSGQSAGLFLKKETTTQVCSFKICDIFKNTLFHITRREAASIIFTSFFFTVPNTTESSSKLLKQSPVKNLQIYEKDNPLQLFSCNFCKTFQNTCCKKQPRTTVPKVVSQ